MPDRDDDAVSLDPLTPEEALRALLAVKPDDPEQSDADNSQREPPTDAGKSS